jgi:F-type H+-transporting ATPase subunit epsilon
MTEKLRFALVSPDRELFSGDVDQVVAPGVEGEFGVLPNHAPFMTVLAPGPLRIFDAGAVRRMFVNGGFADVTPQGLTVLAEDAIDLAEVDAAAIAQQRQDAEEDLSGADSEPKRAAAAQRLARLSALQQALQQP